VGIAFLAASHAGSQVAIVGRCLGWHATTATAARATATPTQSEVSLARTWRRVAPRTLESIGYTLTAASGLSHGGTGFVLIGLGAVLSTVSATNAELLYSERRLLRR